MERGEAEAKDDEDDEKEEKGWQEQQLKEYIFRHLYMLCVVQLCRGFQCQFALPPTLLLRPLSFYCVWPVAAFQIHLNDASKAPPLEQLISKSIAEGPQGP